MVQSRLILSEPADGAMNMALDEALLESAAADGCNSATLRIYRWARPTLSLGYFQRAADREAHAASRDCDLIRRPSGGGAILHDRELTYALVLPAVIVQGGDASGWYFKVHNALIAAICELTGASATLCEDPPKISASDEPFLCFQRRAAGDVLLKSADGEHKIAGSAQRRRRGAILQHGSVLLAHSPHAPELPGIEERASTSIDYESLAELFGREVSRSLKLEFTACSPIEAEQQAAAKLCSQKYATESWTHRR